VTAKYSIRSKSAGLLAVAALFAGACGSNSGGGTGSGAAPSGGTVAGGAAAPVEQATIKVASGQGTYRAGLDVAMARGYFDQEKLKIEIQNVATGPEQVPLMASGQVDVAFTGPSAAHLNALSAGVPVRFVAPCGGSTPDGQIPNAVFNVSKKLYDSGEVTSVRQFKGHKIGIPNKESKAFVDLQAHLEKAGLTIGDVTVVAGLGFPDASAGLASGALDAAFLVEPFATLSQIKGESVIVAGDHQIMAGRLGCGLAFGKRLIEGKELGDRFMRAYLKGVRDYHDAFFNNKGKAEIVKIETSVTPVTDPTLFDKMLPNYIDPNGEINPKSLELDIKVFQKEGHLSQAPELNKILDAGYAERAVKALGRIEVR
jgi:ABC-type nitrate/sulfonate/bicarbonate transport system substrate-binding protein